VQWCATVSLTAGRPYADAELTPAYNPLQAGLWHAVHFDKGCYMGQETIAKVVVYTHHLQQLHIIMYTMLRETLLSDVLMFVAQRV
jgi:folate-binding protein YgfZ